jgi:hypothetical protein
MNRFSLNDKVRMVFYDKIEVHGRYRIGFLLSIREGDHEKVISDINIIRIFMDPGTEKVDEPSIFLVPGVFKGNFLNHGELGFPTLAPGFQKGKEIPQNFLLTLVPGNVIGIGYVESSRYGFFPGGIVRYRLTFFGDSAFRITISVYTTRKKNRNA